MVVKPYGQSWQTSATLAPPKLPLGQLVQVPPAEHMGQLAGMS